MRFFQTLSAAIGLCSIAVAALPQGTERGIPTFANVTIAPPKTNRSSSSYARTATLPGNVLLATWNDFGNSGALPIYRSLDSGRTWKAWGNLTSNTAGRRLVQPHMLWIEEDFGDEDGGVLLLSVNAWDNNSTNIELYSSRDRGKTFGFEAHIATGGRANTTNGATPVWEPYLLRQ